MGKFYIIKNGSEIHFEAETKEDAIMVSGNTNVFEAKKIITEHKYPPIPDRSFDWMAYREGEEDAPYGWGKTEQEAINDLLENEGNEGN